MEAYMNKFLFLTLSTAIVFSSNLMAKKMDKEIDLSHKLSRKVRQVAVDDWKTKYVVEPCYEEIIPYNHGHITILSDRFSYYSYHSDRNGKKIDDYRTMGDGKSVNLKGTLSRDTKPAVPLKKLDKLFVEMNPGAKPIEIQKRLKIAKHAIKIKVDKKDITNTENPPSKLWWKSHPFQQAHQ